MLYEVGKPFNPNLPPIPIDTAQFNYRAGSCELVIFMARPSMQECFDVREGRAEFALYIEGDLIILCYRFGRGQWCDAPYSWHLVPAEQRALPETLLPGQRALLHVILVDRISGRIATHIRLLAFSPKFSVALWQAIRDQSARAWSPSDYDRQLSRLYQRYPDSADLARSAQVRCVGGEE